jgi:integrase
MAKAKITKAVVDRLKSGQVVWDPEIRGFGARCRPTKSGSVVYYVLKRVINGRQRWLTIGLHGSPWTPETARRQALKELGLIADGLDTAAIREARKGIPTFKEGATQWLAEVVEKECKTSTAALYRDLVERLTFDRVGSFPGLGHLKVSEIEVSDVERLRDAVSHAPYQSNRVVAVLSSFFGWAERKHWRPRGSNPCAPIQRFKEAKRERFLKFEELQRLGKVLTEAERSKTETRYAVGALRLLMFTGARRGEVLGLKWPFVDLERGVLRLPDSKTGAKIIHLNAPARMLLSKLPRIKGNEFVFPGALEGKPIINLKKPWQRVRDAAKLEGVRLHDLRHSFASLAAGGGASLQLIGRLLGHTNTATTERYAHLADDPVRLVNERVGKRLAAALAGERGDVVHLSRRRHGKR